MWPERRLQEQGDLSSHRQNVPEIRRTQPFRCTVPRKENDGGTTGGIRAVVKEESEVDKIFYTQEITTNSVDDPQLVTVKLESGNYLRIHPDTGAQCNTIPVHNGFQPGPCEASQKYDRHGGSKLVVVGSVRVSVWRGNYRCKSWIATL